MRKQKAWIEYPLRKATLYQALIDEAIERDDSLDELECAEYAAKSMERILSKILNAADIVLSFDWRENDDDAVAAIEGLREVMPRPLTKAEESFKCKARLSGSDPMPDCDWPMCGCDPYANKVIAALEESGILFKGEL